MNNTLPHQFRAELAGPFTWEQSAPLRDPNSATPYYLFRSELRMAAIPFFQSCLNHWESVLPSMGNLTREWMAGNAQEQPLLVAQSLFRIAPEFVEALQKSDRPTGPSEHELWRGAMVYAAATEAANNWSTKDTESYELTFILPRGFTATVRPALQHEFRSLDTEAVDRRAMVVVASRIPRWNGRFFFNPEEDRPFDSLRIVEQLLSGSLERYVKP